MKFWHRAGVATLAAAAVASIGLGAPRAYAQTPAPTPTPPALAACPADLKITVAAPTAAAPTTVSATITPALNLKAAATGDTTSFHVHYYVDIDPTKTLKPGTPIPSGDPKIIHGAALTQDVGTLAPGAHTVWVVVGQVSHQACGGADGNIITGSTTFNVAAAAAPAASPAPAKTGTGGVEATGEGWSVVLGLLAVTGLGVAAARRTVAR